MARLYRPRIPLSVRVQVAERQVRQSPGLDWGFYLTVDWRRSAGRQLAALLAMLARRLGCEVRDLRLDHDPALCNRQRTGEGRQTRYTPDANDPDYLIYRTRANHDIKTRVRGDGAQHSDLALRRIAKRRERKAARGKLSTKRVAKTAKRRNNRPWPKRPMPQGRGFPTRRG